MSVDRLEAPLQSIISDLERSERSRGGGEARRRREEAEEAEEAEKEEEEEKIKRQGQCWTNRHTSHNQSFPSLGDFLLKESKL